MAMAMMYPEDGGKGGRGKKSESGNLPLNGGFGRERLRQARAVLHFSRLIAQAVLNGTTPLNDALATVKEQEQYQQSDEAKLTRLQESAPDLAEQVNEGDARQRVWLRPGALPLSPTWECIRAPLTRVDRPATAPR